jgi:hypothetical protein
MLRGKSICKHPLSAAWRELQVLLDGEIERLPDTLRAPFISCCLENRSCAETARQLGLREGTVAMRLSRARQQLAQRLKRRGVSLTAVLAAVAVGTNGAAAAVPGSLALATARTATLITAGPEALADLVSTNGTALTEGVLKTMFLSKLKAVAVVIVVGGLMAAGALIAGLNALPETAQAAGQALKQGTTRGIALTFLPAQPEKAKAARYVDLQPHANQKLNETFLKGLDGNNLAELKQDKQTLQGLKFNIGEGLIYLANQNLKDDLPEKVEGIKLDAKFAKLHILHATAYAAEDDTVIAQYVVHYADKSKETIEVVFGKDVRDWWRYNGDQEPTRGKVAWEGSNDTAKANGCSLWLFAMTWKNPHPDKQAVSVDYVSTLTGAAPFVVAMTLGPE